jgi:hypothetical protein
MWVTNELKSKDAPQEGLAQVDHSKGKLPHLHGGGQLGLRANQQRDKQHTYVVKNN